MTVPTHKACRVLGCSMQDVHLNTHRLAISRNDIIWDDESERRCQLKRAPQKALRSLGLTPDEYYCSKAFKVLGTSGKDYSRSRITHHGDRVPCYHNDQYIL
eukprot:c8877_g1_i1.p1 GENE.c8877_g1_i1~~c8877_g1_i1.p1  ORF type:complete len:110 (+),score=11.91 c8877_g1_i1:26-331(+)